MISQYFKAKDFQQAAHQEESISQSNDSLPNSPSIIRPLTQDLVYENGIDYIENVGAYAFITETKRVSVVQIGEAISCLGKEKSKKFGTFFVEKASRRGKKKVKNTFKYLLSEKRKNKIQRIKHSIHKVKDSHFSQKNDTKGLVYCNSFPLNEFSYLASNENGIENNKDNYLQINMEVEEECSCTLHKPSSPIVACKPSNIKSINSSNEEDKTNNTDENAFPRCPIIAFSERRASSEYTISNISEAAPQINFMNCNTSDSAQYPPLQLSEKDSTEDFSFPFVP